MDSLGPSPGYAPSELGLVPEEDVKTLAVVDTRGLGYACPQAQSDLVTPCILLTWKKGM